MTGSRDLVQARRAALGTLAAATPDELARAVERLASDEAPVMLRPPEVGLVMLRGRIGGDGAAFNVGEATVTRATVQLHSAEVGHGYRLGRDANAAYAAAILDALWQNPHKRDVVEVTVLKPIRDRVTNALQKASAEAGATRVEFFTLAREAT